MNALPRRLRALAQAAIVVITVSVLTLAVEHLGWLDHYESAGWDMFSALRAGGEEPAVIGELVVLAIDDEDYERTFDATSPLRCEAVRSVLETLLAAEPRIIGVDLDTSSPSHACLAELPSSRPPIVWARGARFDPEHGRFELDRVLGGAPMPATDRAAIAQIPLDRDGVVRRYRRTLPTAQGEEDTLPWALVATACGRGCTRCCGAREEEHGHEHEPLRLNFGGDPFTTTPIALHDVISIDGAAPPPWNANELLKDRIVILGGTYAAGRDVYATPVGLRPGVQIVAQAMQSDMRGGGIRTMNHVRAFVLDLAFGFGLVLLNQALHRRPGLALAVSLATIAILCPLGSYLAFSTSGFWFNFVPVVVSVLIHQFYEHAREYQRLLATHAPHTAAPPV